MSVLVAVLVIWFLIVVCMALMVWLLGVPTEPPDQSRLDLLDKAREDQGLTDRMNACVDRLHELDPELNARMRKFVLDAVEKDER